MAHIATCYRRNTDVSNARFGFLCYFSSLPLFYSIRLKAFIFFTCGEADRKRRGKCCSSGDHFDSNILSYPANGTVKEGVKKRKKKTFLKMGVSMHSLFVSFFGHSPFKKEYFLGGRQILISAFFTTLAKAEGQ